MIFLNSAPIGLLGGLKSKSLKKETLEYIRRLEWAAIRNFLISEYFIEDYRDIEIQTQEKLEHYLTLTYLRQGAKFLRFLKGRDFELIKIFLQEFDIYNLKLIIHSLLFLPLDYRDKIYKFPFSLFYKKAFKFLNLEELLRFLRKEKQFYEILEPAIRGYRENKDLFDLEIRLDKGWLSLLKNEARNLGSEIYRMVEDWVGINNLLWALRMLFIQEKKPEEILGYLDLETPKFNLILFKELSQKENLDQALESIQDLKNYQGLFLEEDWEKSIKSFYFDDVTKAKIKTVFSLQPILKFLIQQRFYLEELKQILNLKLRNL